MSTCEFGLCKSTMPGYPLVCEKITGHTGPHSAHYREKGAKYSHPMTWPQTDEEFLDAVYKIGPVLDIIELAIENNILLHIPACPKCGAAAYTIEARAISGDSENVSACDVCGEILVPMEYQL